MERATPGTSLWPGQAVTHPLPTFQDTPDSWLQPLLCHSAWAPVSRVSLLTGLFLTSFPHSGSRTVSGPDSRATFSPAPARTAAGHLGLEWTVARSTPWCLEGRSLCVNISVRPGKCEIQSDSGNLREIAVLIPVLYMFMFIFLWSKFLCLFPPYVWGCWKWNGKDGALRNCWSSCVSKFDNLK